jgi:hypothetical protein
MTILTILQVLYQSSMLGAIQLLNLKFQVLRSLRGYQNFWVLSAKNQDSNTEISFNLLVNSN